MPPSGRSSKSSSSSSDPTEYSDWLSARGKDLVVSDGSLDKLFPPGSLLGMLDDGPQSDFKAIYPNHVHLPHILSLIPPESCVIHSKQGLLGVHRSLPQPSNSLDHM